MELITAITNLDWTEVFMTLIVLFVMFRGGRSPCGHDSLGF